MSGQPSPLRSVRWAWVVLAGLAANVATAAVLVIVVAVYAAVLAGLSRGRPDSARVAGLAAQSGWAAPLLALVLAGVAAAFVGRRVSSSPATHGALVGLVAAVASVLIGLVSGGSQPWVEAVLFVATVAAGWLGGLEARFWRRRAS
jgi:hypothetical protein